MEFAALGRVQVEPGDHLGWGHLCCCREVSPKTNLGRQDQQSVSGKQESKCGAFFKKLNLRLYTFYIFAIKVSFL